MPSSERFGAVFKAYDIRGTVPDQLDHAMVEAIGAAFAAFCRDSEGASAIVVGRDMRDSGVPFSRAFARGARNEGLDVVDAGLISTDMIYFASGSLGLPGAVLTASHNPAQYNGIKFCRAGARPIGQDTGLAEIRRLAEVRLDATEAAGGSQPLPDEMPEGVEQVDVAAGFAEHVHGFVDTGSLRPLKIVADAANGMGGLVAPAVLGGLGFQLQMLYGELDGNFPNHPADPLNSENLVDLQARVLETGADIGLAFDGDADRVFLVDEKARLISGSLTTAIVAAAMLDAHSGETVLYNLICSKAVPEVIAEHGGTSVRTRVGHSFIKTVMEETGAVFGGEHSGHYYFRENFRADSGIIAAMVVLGVLSSSDVPLSELRRPFERYAGSGEINTEVADAAAVLREVEATYEGQGATLDHLDGLTVDLGGWWFNLRPSNTEPLLRLNLEAASAEQCAEQVAEVLDRIRHADEQGQHDDVAQSSARSTEGESPR